MNLIEAKASEIIQAIKERRTSAVEVCQFFLNRCKLINPKINAFISINDKALDRAAYIDKLISDGQDPGVLAGLPIGVKDLLCTSDQITTAGSKMLENFSPAYSSTVVERLEAEGAIILGKTNLDEFAMGSSNETSFFGAVKNPWNTDCVPGGSSGGSAAAVAARMCPVAIGTDTGGSIRQPASFCGVVGIKPTYGRVSRYGIVAFASSLDQAGPMGTFSEDCALVLRVISGFDKKDSTSSKKTVPDFTKSLRVPTSGLKVAIPNEYFAEGLCPEVKKNIEALVESLKEKGVAFDFVDLKLTKYAVATYYIIASSEASSNLSRYDGVRFGHRSKNSSSLESLYKNSRGEGFGEEVKRRIMLGTYALSSGYYDAYYTKACQVRQMIQDDFLKIFADYDLILGPVSTTTAFKINEKTEDPLSMYLNDIYTLSTNLAGLPGISVPIGFDSKGLPIGVQLMARHFDEEKIFSLSNEIEKICTNKEMTPNVF